MEINSDNNYEKYVLLVDSHNSARTFGVARNKHIVKHNKLILEMPPIEIIHREIGGLENDLLLFPFGRYIVIYKLEKDILFFIDYTLEVDKPILELLLQCKVSDTFLDHFFITQFRQQTTLKLDEYINVLIKIIENDITKK